MDTVPPATEGLARHLCQVMGLNQSYSSKLGTAYHLQIEDRGPVVEPVSERWVRRINVIVYANYGEPNARIIFCENHDLADVRSQEQNQAVENRIQELALETFRVVDGGARAAGGAARGGRGRCRRRSSSRTW